MDVTTLLAKLPEPSTTAQLSAFLTRARAHLAPEQLAAMEPWSNLVPFEQEVLDGLWHGRQDVVALRRYSRRLAKDDRAKDLGDARLAAIPALLEHAATSPAVVSALIWQWLGARDPDVASHLVHFVRQRANLPGLRRGIEADEPQSMASPHPLHVSWFADRQFEDAASWIEAVPAAVGDTLADAAAATQAQRLAAPGIAPAELAPFLRQAASFITLLSTRGLDPLGFSLSREVQLASEPNLDDRLALAAWARRAGHAICARGHVVVMSIAVAAPWPLWLEVIAAELGRGACGGCGLLLRLRGSEAIAAPTPAPLMLCLPGEPIEERGARFERWMAWAYPHATDAWRPWC